MKRKYKKVFAQLTQTNPLFNFTRYYKLKYLPFDYPTYYKEICFVWENRCLPPDKILNDHLWEFHKNKHKPLQSHLTQCNSSKIILFFNPYFRYSKLLPSHSLSFNPARETCELSPLDYTRSYMSSSDFIKRFKPKSVISHHSKFSI